jgi:hypothetical protein
MFAYLADGDCFAASGTVTLTSWAPISGRASGTYDVTFSPAAGCPESSSGSFSMLRDVNNLW